MRNEKVRDDGRWAKKVGRKSTSDERALGETGKCSKCRVRRIGCNKRKVGGGGQSCTELTRKLRTRGHVQCEVVTSQKSREARREVERNEKSTGMDCVGRS